jgi:hypothetical protein
MLYRRGVTFRDDHDAALARADALERDLDRAERERNELKERVESLERAAAAGTSAVARVAPAPLERTEASRLVQLVQEGAEHARDWRLLGYTVLLALIPVLILAAGAGAGTWDIIYGAVLATGAAAGLVRGGSKSSHVAAVIKAINEDPGQVVKVRSLSGSLWPKILIETSEHRLLAGGKHTGEMIALLARHCPRAKFDGG